MSRPPLRRGSFSWTQISPRVLPSHAIEAGAKAQWGLPGTREGSKLAPPWQVAQPVVMPVWFIFHVENAVVLVWQVSHGAVVGMCVVGLPSAWVPLWQLAHPVVMPV